MSRERCIETLKSALALSEALNTIEGTDKDQLEFLLRTALAELIKSE